MTESTDHSLATRSDIERGTVGALLTVIIITAILGNILVILAINMSHRLKEQASNIFIINLCLTDLSSATVVMATALYALISDTHTINIIWCNIICAANYCFIIVSMMTLAAISVERLIAIKFSMRYDVLVTKTRVKIVCCYTWIQGIAFALAPVILEWIHYDYWEVICAIDWQQEKTKAVYYVAVAFSICFVAPGFTMLGSYLVIMQEARSMKRISPAEGTNANLQQQTQVLKTITSLLVVVALFFLCMTPFCVTKLLKVVIVDPKFVPDYANLTASYFAYVSSMVNPLIYGIFRREFRAAFKKTIRKMSAQVFGLEFSVNASRRGSNNSGTTQ